MLATCEQANLGRSQSWDTLGGNEGHWEREGERDGAYDHHGRISEGRRSSLTFGGGGGGGAGGGGGWYEPPSGARPPYSELKREPCSYQENLHTQGYLQERHDPQPTMRKSSVPELSHYERQAVGARGPPQEYYQPQPDDPRAFYRGGGEQQQHLLSRATTPTPYGAGAGARVPYTSDPPPPMPGRPVYSDVNVNGRPLDPRAPRPPTCLAVDPGAPGMEGNMSRAGMVVSPVPYGHIPAAKLPGYDPGYDPGVVAIRMRPVTPLPAATPAPAPLPSPLPRPLPTATPAPVTVATADPKRTADPGFLALLRSEGLSESTIASLLRQGFDSPGTLALLEENDARSVAPNLGQTRVLSRVAQGLRRPVEAPPLPPAPIQQLQPPGRAVAGRRPSSAPSQHLLETAPPGYPMAFPAGGGYGNPPAAPPPSSPRPSSAYTAHPGFSAPQQPSPFNATVAPKAYSTTYTSPMMAPGSVLLHHQTQAVPGQLSRRTGPPVIVSTMASSPESSNYAPPPHGPPSQNLQVFHQPTVSCSSEPLSVSGNAREMDCSVSAGCPVCAPVGRLVLVYGHASPRRSAITHEAIGGGGREDLLRAGEAEGKPPPRITLVGGGESVGGADGLISFPLSLPRGGREQRVRPGQQSHPSRGGLHCDPGAEGVALGSEPLIIPLHF
ncbi:hypothetical protein AAFF_G00085940 [Aldrovandia affinis]|uniref:Uncharacterized protein n=1 Tax=Aldrovandia affinis TaxID=143900 RepID=A0AAD7RX12_9TELE|nr:hypothetical protein AAFF_G00085940 [Aldrovandia affinis]